MQSSPTNRKRISKNQGNGKAPIIFAAIGLIIIYFIFFHGEHGLIQYWKLFQERNELVEKIEQLKNEQKQLKDEIELLENNDQYIEKTARERYNMGREGERVYIIKKEATQ